MKFEWDEDKADRHELKHGVSFDEATTIFGDSLALTGRDPDHSLGERRFITFGVSSALRLWWSRTLTEDRSFESSVREQQLARSDEFMKKPKKEDDLRNEYQREDFGVMTRGKYAARVAKASNVVVIDPQLAKVFPNAEAVNDALRGLVEIARSSTRAASRGGKASGKKAAA